MRSRRTAGEEEELLPRHQSRAELKLKFIQFGLSSNNQQSEPDPAQIASTPGYVDFWHTFNVECGHKFEWIYNFHFVSKKFALWCEKIVLFTV